MKPRIVERNSVIPFRKAGRTLHLAMARPSDEPAIRAIALPHGPARPAHVAMRSGRLAIEKHYGVQAAPHFKDLARVLERGLPPCHGRLPRAPKYPSSRSSSPAHRRRRRSNCSPASPWPGGRPRPALAAAQGRPVRGPESRPGRPRAARLPEGDDRARCALPRSGQRRRPVAGLARLAQVPGLSIPLSAGSLFSSLRNAGGRLRGALPGHPGEPADPRVRRWAPAGQRRRGPGP